MKPWACVLIDSLLHLRPDRFLWYVWAHRLQVKQNSLGYQLTKDGITLLSPTRNFKGFGNTTFHKKFERYFHISEGDVCLDVGACIGDTAIPILEKSKGKLIAIEPDPTNLRYLKLNLLSYPSATIIPKAVYKCKSLLPWHKSDAITGHSIAANCQISKTEVETDTLDNILGDTKVDFAKIDVQGAEVEVLEGAPNFLKSVRKLAVETHNRNSPEATYPKVITLLEKHDFTIHYAHDTGIVHASR